MITIVPLAILSGWHFPHKDDEGRYTIDSTNPLSESESHMPPGHTHSKQSTIHTPFPHTPRPPPPLDTKTSVIEIHISVGQEIRRRGLARGEGKGGQLGADMCPERGRCGWIIETEGVRRRAGRGGSYLMVPPPPTGVSTVAAGRFHFIEGDWTQKAASPRGHCV